MKNLLLLVLVSAVLMSCSNTEDEEKTKTSEKVVLETKKPAGPTINLRYKFKKGDKFTYRLQTISNNSEEIVADTAFTNKITQTASYTFNFKVLDVDEYNIAKLEARIKSITAETTANDQSMKYDSKMIYSSREKVQFVDYEAVKNVPFKIDVNELGRVVKVHGINKIMNNILAIQNVPDTLSKNTREKMRDNISNGTLMPLSQQIFKVVSEKEVGIDSVWQLNYKTPLAVFTVENTAIFKIENITFDKDTTASIKSNLVINVQGNNVLNEQGFTYTFAKPNLTANGSVTFNNTIGLVEISESVTNLEMTMFVEGLDSKNQRVKSTKRDITNNTNIVELL